MIHRKIGNNLERIRKAKGLSLDKAADATGVSKATLYQIERGETQPTVTTVWKIATGLHISFSSLIKNDETKVSIVSRSELPHVTEDNGKCKVYLLFPYDPQTRFEMYSIVLEPGAMYASLPHNEGVEEYITVVSGLFTLKVREETYRLSEGQAIRFNGNTLHIYKNETDQEAVLHVTMQYAEI
ncbi:helix-turn-helix domain-containing protein [Priestia megaterium]|uniref:helix-turn-helix domain-containing protein n=1 Tax=Priestia megaterium TaxID=1404 RepID=UPI0036727CBE